MLLEWGMDSIMPVILSRSASKRLTRYWQSLSSANDSSTAWEYMVKWEGWEHLRSPDGANPLLVLVHEWPILLVNEDLNLYKAIHGMDKDAFSSRLGEVDHQGQDL